MSQPTANTPVLIAASQFTERLDQSDYRGLSPVQITTEAARLALDDAGVSGLAQCIDCVMTTRTFEDSAPVLAFPFGRSNNFPRSVCRQLGIDPETAIWATSGGDTPQKLVVEACKAIAAGQSSAVLIAGGEAMSTAKQLVKSGASVDWSESLDAPVDDRGPTFDFLTGDEIANGLVTPPLFHGLIENARRGQAGASRADWARRMGELFAPFTRVAADNPYSAFDTPAMAPDALITPGPGNRYVVAPYPQRLIARDQVNQSAALVIVASSLADALGIDPERRVYLHGHASAGEPPVTRRPQMGQAPSAATALKTALARSGQHTDEIDYFDFYSCFPVAVSNAIEPLGLSFDDPRGLTVTGGLPFFGGPGNNYSMHALAEMVTRLRQNPGTMGLVAANGGFLSKYAVGIYSTRPAVFDPSVPIDEGQSQALAADGFESRPEGCGVIESYTAAYDRSGAVKTGIIVGTMAQSGARFIAKTAAEDIETATALVSTDPLGQSVLVAPTETGNHFTLI